jgi:hypothetical protein
MGFGGFGTTQVSQPPLAGAREIEEGADAEPFSNFVNAKQGKEHVQEIEGVATKQERHYRQVSAPTHPLTRIRVQKKLMSVCFPPRAVHEPQRWFQQVSPCDLVEYRRFCATDSAAVTLFRPLDKIR